MGNWNNGPSSSSPSSSDYAAMEDAYDSDMGYDTGPDLSTNDPSPDSSPDPSPDPSPDYGYDYPDYSPPSPPSGGFPDSDNDGIPDSIDVDSGTPSTPSYGYDYPDYSPPPSFEYDYSPPSTSTGTYGAPTSFSDVYDPFSGGSYVDTSPPGDSDNDGVPDYLDTDTSKPYDPYSAWQALPDYSFQKQLVKNPTQALNAFNAKAKKIDTLKNGTEVYTVKVNQKNPISGEVEERSFVYTTSASGVDVKNLYNVTDENKLSDALGNTLGFALPVAMGLPGRAKVDTKVMSKYSMEPSPFKEYDVSKQYYETSALTAFEKELTRSTRIETEAERTARLAAEAAQRGGDGDGGSGYIPPASSEIIEDVEEPEKDYEYWLKKFGVTPTTSYSPYDVMRGRVPYSTQTAAVGGQIEQNDYLTVNAEYVKQMPDAFMRDPATAKSADEVRAIFAHNRRVKEIAGGMQTMSDGGQAVEPGNVAVVGESGPIVANPEEVTEAESVADNVEKTVPEGTFIINQPAAELMGTSDVKDMLLNAVKELRKQGVDFSFGEGKIPEEDAVSLLVSKGEIMVHPLLVPIIGLGRLNKINNRGKAEVERRIAENGQSPEAEQAQAVAATGGITRAQGERGSSGDQSYVAVEGQYEGEGFVVRPGANYSEQERTRNFPNGEVVNQKGKNIGFALNGEMFLTDDASLRAGMQRQASQSKTKVSLPENYGGQTLEFGGGQKMKRYNMGATFGDFSADVSKQQGSGQPLSGRVQYKFSPQGEVFIEGTEGGRSGRIGLQYRF